MLKFNNNHIFTGYIKQLLASFNLPTYKVYKKEYLDYKNTYGVEDPRIISSEPKTGTTFPDHMLYVNYIKNNHIQRYYNGTWHPTSLHYHYNKKELNQTRSLKVKDNIYTSDTHEYLGEYLRFQRDYNNLDLMPLYNCFSDRLCPLLQITFDVPVYVPSVNSTVPSYSTKQIMIDSTDSNYKIYMLPVKLFEKYTIAVSSLNTEIFCGFYGSYYDDRAKLKIIPAITYQHYSELQFNQPILYDKLSCENITANEVRAAELAQIERNLKMFIKVPASNNSSIVVLEGDYTAYNKSIFTPTQFWNASYDDIKFATNSGNVYTEYYRKDEYLRRLVGITEDKSFAETPDSDGNITRDQVKKTITTIIDNYVTNDSEILSAEDADAKVYKNADTNLVLASFLTKLGKAEDAELNLTASYTDSESFETYTKEYTSNWTILDDVVDNTDNTPMTYDLFIFTTELVIKPEGDLEYLDGNPLGFTVESFYDKLNGSYPKLEESPYRPKFYFDKQQPKEIRYNLTLTAQLPNDTYIYDAENPKLSTDETFNYDIKLKAPTQDCDYYRLVYTVNGEEEYPTYSITAEEYLIYDRDDDQTIQVTKIDPLTGLPEYEEIYENGYKSWREIKEDLVIPGEPLEYNSRTFRLPYIPNNKMQAFGKIDLAEGTTEEEQLFIKTPVKLANGYIALCNQPSQTVNNQEIFKEDNDVLYDYDISTKVKVDGFQLEELKEATEENSMVEEPFELKTVSGNSPTISWKYKPLNSEAYITLEASNAAKIVIYCARPTIETEESSDSSRSIDETTSKIATLDNELEKEPEPDSNTGDNVESITPLYLCLYHQYTGELLEATEIPDTVKEPIVFTVVNGGSYKLQVDYKIPNGSMESSTNITDIDDEDDYELQMSYQEEVAKTAIYYIEVLNQILVGDSWTNSKNRFVTNYETSGFTTVTDNSGATVYEENGEPKAELIAYPDIEDRPFNPITTLQLLKHNTGTSYPFADRLLEYLLGNAITHLDENSDNVKRVQKIAGENGHSFKIDGAWEGKIKNILYDYMTLGHPTGEQLPLEATHDILGYVDKDTEKFYTSWSQVPCYDKNGNPIYALDSNGNRIRKIIDRKLAANDGIDITENLGRLLLVNDTTTGEYLYKTKYKPNGTILNADLYADLGYDE